jgi:hypothetical protein
MAYPYEEGDQTVIGPECFASEDGRVLSWRGENYVRQTELLWLRNVLFGLMFAVFVGALIGLVFAASAPAETGAQRHVAVRAVAHEARQLQREHRYRRGNVTVTPRADWWVWGTTANGPVVTLAWRIRVAQPRRSGLARWLVCRGHVTVSGDQVHDSARLSASLTTDQCVA